MGHFENLFVTHIDAAAAGGAVAVEHDRPIPQLAALERLPALPESPTIPNAALRTVAGQRGVWKITDGALAFAPVRLGRADLDGQVQVLDGLAVGDSIVLYSEKALTTKSRVHVVERIAGVAP